MSENESGGQESNGVVCPTCDKSDFASENGMKIHHAMVHDEPAPWDLRTCNYCGKEYRGTKRSRNENHYCSRDCYASWLSENTAGENSPSYNGGKVEVECAACGASLWRYPANVKAHQTYYCDDDCRGVFISRHYQGEDHPGYNRVTIECDWCGTSFDRVPSHVHDENNFCSDDCRWDWFSGETGPLWCGGEFPYGPGWNEAKKEEVRERDNRTCQNPQCRRSEEEHVELFGRKHSVHHIQKARSFDDPNKRNHPDNLVTLCETAECHKRWESMSPLQPQVVDEAGD